MVSQTRPRGERILINVRQLDILAPPADARGVEDLQTLKTSAYMRYIELVLLAS